MQNASILQEGSDIIARLHVTLDDHLYLLHHAIGGVVRKSYRSDEQVFLMPLTVAIEMMAEVASYFYPDLKVSAIENVRAYKRIRVGSEGMSLVVRARLLDAQANKVQVTITRADQSEAELMHCQVVFCSEFADQKPQFSLPKVNWRSSQIPSNQLYGQGAMFHGPTMQSVTALNGVADRDIYAEVSARLPADWTNSDQKVFD